MEPGDRVVGHAASGRRVFGTIESMTNEGMVVRLVAAGCKTTIGARYSTHIEYSPRWADVLSKRVTLRSVERYSDTVSYAHTLGMGLD